MKKFEKLSRAEMRNVMAGGNNGCPGGGCLQPFDCLIVGHPCTIGPGSVYGQGPGICIVCTCTGQPPLACSPIA